MQHNEQYSKIQTSYDAFEPGPKPSPEVEPETTTPEIEPMIPPDSPLPNITL